MTTVDVKRGHELFAGYGSLAGRQLHVSRDGRYMVLDDNRPFFYLADTAWTLFKRLTHGEVETYFDTRIRQGFTTIQAYVLRGLAMPNLYGELPLTSHDPGKLNDAFFSNVDWIINEANSRGLLMGLVTTFGEHVRAGNILTAIGRGHEAIFDERGAYRFGAALGERYQGSCILWLLGGDRNPLLDLPLWRRMAEGLKEGSHGTHLVSYHGGGGTSSSHWFHEEPWLDLNTIQSGHREDVPNYVFISHDRSLRPVKPTLDMEPCYENHPDMGPSDTAIIGARAVRSAGYWAMLAGAAGHGYGANEIWQFAREESMACSDYAFPNLPPLVGWQKAMDFEGAWGMTWLRRCFEERPWYRLCPLNYLDPARPVRGSGYVASAMDAEANVSISYLSRGATVEVDLAGIGMSRASATWYDPRTGAAEAAGEVRSGRVESLKTPSADLRDDWVLFLEGAD